MYSYFKKYRKVAEAAASSPTAHAEHCSFVSGGVSLPPPPRSCLGFEEDQLIEKEELSPEWMRRRERAHRKKPIPEVRAANSLDQPLGLKLPAIPGSSNVHCTANTCEKVVCTLKELKKYRHYLTNLKLDFERNYTREQKMIEKRVNRFYETKRSHENCECSRFQEWLLREKRTPPDQELLIQNRYVDMINRKLNKAEQPADKWNMLQIKAKEGHQPCVRRNHNLHKQFEEEWKTKELLLLKKIREEVKRETKVEEQYKNIREKAQQKKLALLERKIAYHLQKMQKNELKRQEADRCIFKNKAQDESGSILHCKTCLKIPNKMSSNLILPRHNAQRKTTKQKKDNIQNDKEIIKRSHPLNDKGIKSTSCQYPGVSTKTENIPRQFVQHFLKKKREEMKSSPKPTTPFLQTLLSMTTSSYSEEDLFSISSDDDDDSRSVPSAKVTEDSFELDSPSSIKTDTPNISERSSKMLINTSSIPSRKFSRSKDNVPNVRILTPSPGQKLRPLCLTLI